MNVHPWSFVALSSVMIIVASHRTSFSATHPSPAEVADREFRIDAGHSTVEFEIPFMYSRVRGRFDDVAGTIMLADSTHGGAVESSVMVVIRTASINTGSTHRNEHLRSADFFDVERFPVIVFRSLRIVRRAPDYEVAGALTMHGITRSVRIPCRLLVGPTDDPHNITIAEFAGHTTLARQDFGITGGDAHNPWFDRLRSATMGDSVRINLEVHAWAADLTHPSPAVAATMGRIDSIGIDSAVAHLRAAFVRDSSGVAGSEYSLDLVGRELLARGRSREGFLWLHALARLLPRSTSAMVSVGYANQIMGDTARAAAWYRQALAVDSLDPRANLHLTLLHSIKLE
jgi:polyisoprenoid-binding protein YceI